MVLATMENRAVESKIEVGKLLTISGTAFEKWVGLGTIIETILVWILTSVPCPPSSYGPGEGK